VKNLFMATYTPDVELGDIVGTFPGHEIESRMKRYGKALDRMTLEESRPTPIERVREDERLLELIASFRRASQEGRW
jgi:hypothetical protein